MKRTMEGTHTGFLRQITGKRAQRKPCGMWVTLREKVVWEASGTQSKMTYIGRRQGTVIHWVALRPIFEVCAGETGYEEGRRRRDAWWHQEAEDKHIIEKLEEI